MCNLFPRTGYGFSIVPQHCYSCSIGMNPTLRDLHGPLKIPYVEWGILRLPEFCHSGGSADRTFSGFKIGGMGWRAMYVFRLGVEQRCKYNYP